MKLDRAISFFSFIVAALSFLVTVILGFQIFNYFAFEDKMDKRIEQSISKIKRRIKK